MVNKSRVRKALLLFGDHSFLLCRVKLSRRVGWTGFRHMKNAKRLAITVLALTVLVPAVIGTYLRHYALTPAVADTSDRKCFPTGTEVVVIPRGAGIRDVARLLSRRDIIRQPKLFRLLARVKTRHASIKAGEHRLSPMQTPLSILDKLIQGEVVLHKLTVPEGYTARQISALVGRSGLTTAAAFMQAAFDAGVAGENGISAKSCEGYLFPETYYFPVSVSAERIVATMVKRFWAVFTEKYRERSRKLGFTVHQIVILASMIEKETAAAGERPLIAAVFHNRLKKHMRLESDPTVIYGISDFDGNITRRHLETKTPYNTYRIRGLPAGPIANPGEKSLKAALYPAEAPYLFFVAKGNGSHQFSTNIADHNRAVRRYQLRH